MVHKHAKDAAEIKSGFHGPANPSNDSDIVPASVAVETTTIPEDDIAVTFPPEVAVANATLLDSSFFGGGNSFNSKIIFIARYKIAYDYLISSTIKS